MSYDYSHFMSEVLSLPSLQHLPPLSWNQDVLQILTTKTMGNQSVFNSDLHFEHVQWKSELFFWEDEIKTFKHRLEELVVRWTDKDVLRELEQFQNQFILHNEVIDTLQHEINIHEKELGTLEMANETALNTAHTKDHLVFRGKMEMQREIYADLKKKFFRFLSKYM